MVCSFVYLDKLIDCLPCSMPCLHLGSGEAGGAHSVLPTTMQLEPVSYRLGPTGALPFFLRWVLLSLDLRLPGELIKIMGQSLEFSPYTHEDLS